MLVAVQPHRQAGFPTLNCNDRLQTRLICVCSEIVARLMGRDAGDEEASLRALTITGQLVAIHLTRRSMMLSLGWESIDTHRLNWITSIIDRQTAQLLEEVVSERPAKIVREGSKAPFPPQPTQGLAPRPDAKA
ncbi:CerR family C-terminal domain-containing protein [Paraburkholderia sp. CNPSo 3076]|nr:CerR family C-terminal domain-containing protein [Paraburkholderia sp. CNPSo 3076]